MILRHPPYLALPNLELRILLLQMSAGITGMCPIAPSCGLKFFKGSWKVKKKKRLRHVPCFVFIFELENENLSKKMSEELCNFLRFLNIQRLGPIISSSILRQFKKK